MCIEDMSPCLLWLIARLSKKQREVLNACIQLSDESGEIDVGEYQSVYQRVAEHCKRSPGYANIALLELSWLGLVEISKGTRWDISVAKKMKERCTVVGKRWYETWYIQTVLGAEQISGRSEIVYNEEWKSYINAVQE